MLEQKRFELPVLFGPSDARERSVSRQISAFAILQGFTRSSHHRARFALAISLFQATTNWTFSRMRPAVRIPSPPATSQCEPPVLIILSLPHATRVEPRWLLF